MAVGSAESSSKRHKKAELYDFSTGKWIQVDSYPFGGNCLCDHDMVFIPETSSYYVIGGEKCPDSFSQIGKFTDGAWSDAGHLKVKRQVSFRVFNFLQILIID